MSGILIAAAAKILGIQPNVNVQEYLTPGTYTWTVPAGVNQIWVDANSGGGGGGGGHPTGGGGGGGGGASFAYQLPLKIPPGVTSLEIIVGAGGTAGAVDQDGGNGGATQIKTGASTYILALATTFGGKKGLAASASENGGRGSSNSFTYLAAVGGTGSGEGVSGTKTDVNPIGLQNGSMGGGGGGVNAGVGGNGGYGGYSHNGSGNIAGGAAVGALAGGGGGGISISPYLTGGVTYLAQGGSNTTPGGTPTVYGAGGSGGATNTAGGAGAAGFVRITW